MRSKGFWFLVTFCLIISYAKADFPKPAVSKVPLYRLVMNLENMKSRDPENPHHYYTLGRLYAMAYSLKKDTMEAVLKKGDEDYTPFYGFDKPLNHFFPVRQVKDSSRNGFARECLKRATDNFSHSVRLDSSYIPSLLGLAWTLDQMGDRENAVALYRKILQRTGRLERDGYITTESFETAGYLIRLLDKEKDQEEIAKLQNKMTSFKPSYMISPVLIPLEDDLSFEELVDTCARVRFDLDGTGVAKDWQWLSSKAGWLVYVKPGDEVESGHQLFGSRTFNIFWENGYNAMRSLDDNQNGTLEGAELEHLAVWQDKNSNGISEKTEIFSLDRLNIASFDYSYETLNPQLLKSSQGVKLKNGITRPSFDWFPRCVSPAL